MKLPFGRNRSIRKCDGVADAINRFLFDLVSRCKVGEDILDTCFVGVIGYGSKWAKPWEGN